MTVDEKGILYSQGGEALEEAVDVSSLVVFEARLDETWSKLG